MAAPKSKNGYGGDTNQIGSLMRYKGVGLTGSKKKDVITVLRDKPKLNHLGEIVGESTTITNLEKITDDEGNITLNGTMPLRGIKGRSVTLEEAAEITYKNCEKRGKGKYYSLENGQFSVKSY
jgi:hypothetical protein